MPTSGLVGDLVGGVKHERYMNRARTAVLSAACHPPADKPITLSGACCFRRALTRALVSGGAVVAGRDLNPRPSGYEPWVRQISPVCTSERQGARGGRSSWSVRNSATPASVLIGRRRRREVSGALTKALTSVVWGLDVVPDRVGWTRQAQGTPIILAHHRVGRDLRRDCSKRPRDGDHGRAVAAGSP